MDNSELYESEKIIEEVPKNRKGRIIFSLLITFFCLVVFACGASFFTGEERSFSQAENRVLASMPEVSFYSVKDGSFMENFESYLTDQFIFRDEVIRIKTLIDRMTGKTLIGGVYVGKDGYLFSVPASFNEKQVEKTTEGISNFADKNKNSSVVFMLSPNSSYVYSDKLPSHLTLADQSYRIEDIGDYIRSKKVGFINLSETFVSAKDETELFYKTDHHWTTGASHIAFLELMKHWKKDAGSVGYSFLSVADDFQGTLSSKSGVISAGDHIEICVPKKSELTYTVNYEGEERKTATLFDTDKLLQKNKYEVFAGGNFGKIIIDTTSSSKDTLLIVKDSYANCMLPMFTPFFAKIVVVDPRYTKEKLSSIVEENSFSHVLFLYNLDTFLEDTSLVDVLE